MSPSNSRQRRTKNAKLTTTNWNHVARFALFVLSCSLSWVRPTHAVVFFRMDCGPNGSAWPNCGFTNNIQTDRPDLYPRFFVWSRQTASPPSGRPDYARVVHHYPNPGWNPAGDTAQYYHGWSGTPGVPVMGFNQSMFYRFRMRHVTTAGGWGGYEFDPDASPRFLSASTWGTKFILLGQGGSIHPDPAFQNEGDSFSRVIMVIDEGHLGIARNIESPGGPKGAEAAISMDQWHDVQFELHTSASHTSMDGYLKLWVDNNNYNAPTGQSQGMLLSPDFYDANSARWIPAGLGPGSFNSGTTRGFANETSQVTYDLTDFEIDSQFSPTWDLGGETPPPSACDLNGNGVSVTDVQLCSNQAISVAACLPAGQPGSGDINRDSQCNVIDVQRVVNAALGGICLAQ